MKTLKQAAEISLNVDGVVYTNEADNGAVNWAVHRAVVNAVNGDVNDAVYWVVNRAVVNAVRSAVNDPVYWAVNRIIYRDVDFLLYSAVHERIFGFDD